MQSDDTTASHLPTPPEIIVSEEDTRVGDEEVAVIRPSTYRAGTGRSSASPLVTEETELQTRPNSLSDTAAGSSAGYIKKKASQLLDVLSISGSQKSSKPLSPRLSSLLKAYADSEVAASIRSEIEASRASVANGNGNGNGHVSTALPDVAGETAVLRTHSRASWGTQFRILSGRAFKNLYRDPALLTAHYASSIIIARE